MKSLVRFPKGETLWRGLARLKPYEIFTLNMTMQQTSTGLETACEGLCTGFMVGVEEPCLTQKGGQGMKSLVRFPKGETLWRGEGEAQALRTIYS